MHIGYRYVPLVTNTFWSFPHSWLITGFLTRETRRVPLVEQEVLTLPEHLSSHLIFSGVRGTRSLALCVMFCRLFFFFWPLCCLSFFYLLILISPLVSSNSSYKHKTKTYCTIWRLQIIQLCQYPQSVLIYLNIEHLQLSCNLISFISSNNNPHQME